MSVRASHILIKHKQSRRLASWKDPNGEAIKARSKDEAIRQLTEIRRRIVEQKEDFGSIAATESDCSSARNQGDLGTFGRGQMQRPFEDATYALEVGQISGIVDTDSGVHIILRTA